MSAAARCCTTGRRNAHGTGFERELLYPWHPWTGRQIFIHEVVEKKDAAVFRCTLSGPGSDRWLEVPAWMFDRVPSASWRITDAPHVDLAALGALATLLRGTVAPSQSHEMGAALGSHEANRRDVHAAQAHDIPVRSVLQAERRRGDANAAMADAARRDASIRDEADGKPDPRSPRRRALSRREGGAS